MAWNVRKPLRLRMNNRRKRNEKKLVLVKDDKGKVMRKINDQQLSTKAYDGISLYQQQTDFKPFARSSSNWLT